VVEDEDSISDPLSYMLRNEGFEVAVADSGPAAAPRSAGRSA
jgi:two-component system response regulator RegX3